MVLFVPSMAGRVISSAYSMSLPTASPQARRVTLMPAAVRRDRRHMAVAAFRCRVGRDDNLLDFRILQPRNQRRNINIIRPPSAGGTIPREAHDKAPLYSFIRSILITSRASSTTRIFVQPRVAIRTNFARIFLRHISTNRIYICRCACSWWANSQNLKTSSAYPCRRRQSRCNRLRTNSR